MRTSRQRTGAVGEQLALQHLQQHGYTIVARNWLGKSGEIDLVVTKDQTTVFVEVRSQHAETTAVIFDSLNTRKQANMEAVVYEYLSENTPDADGLWRIDLIAVALRRNAPPVLDHVEDVLGW